MRILLLVVSILAALVPGAWCVQELMQGGSLSFSSVTAFLPALAALIGFFAMGAPRRSDVGSVTPVAPAVAAHDLELFERFQKELPFNPTVKLLREADFGADYRAEWLQPLNRFVEDWDNPNYEFLDPALNEARSILYASARSLAFDFARETVPHDGNEGWRTVYPWRDRTGPRPQHVLESARVLNEASRSFVPLYENFVRLGRQRLNVPA
ncbi:hypothetical protein VPH13_07770 [Stenotrophomonas pavanii]|uniref:hypothetical protein n=1 Tax=Stenotrophomonas pavanii TaxID=487698 RepID=UPI002DB6625E|nr:hypothetical protein [Stenotrophomonas pavanii]MEC4338613.1 hypothetical protein [Stenotrophomonas pavanii]